MRKKVTLKELAKLLNVSISTVSKALNDSPEISPETRRKVKELAEINHYIPNIHAQNLKTNQTKTIGVVIPSILPHFFAKALHGIETKASELGYRIIISLSNESTRKEKESIEMLVRSQVDGLIVSLSKETQANMDIAHLNLLLESGIPLVLFDRVLEQIACDKIHINDALQAEEATIDLFNSGCKKIAYFSGISETSVDQQRCAGYMEAIKRLKMSPEIVCFSHKEFPDRKLKNLIENKKLDGILVSDELGAIRTINSILNSKYKVPEDVAVIGFTNGIMSANFRPSLSTVDQKEEEQGKLALETMVDRIEGRLDEPLNYSLATNLIHRQSTKSAISN